MMPCGINNAMWHPWLSRIYAQELPFTDDFKAIVSTELTMNDTPWMLWYVEQDTSNFTQIYDFKHVHNIVIKL